MGQPRPYGRTKNFTADLGSETDHSALNAELDAAGNSINDIRANIAILQADDGKLRPEVVTVDSITPALRQSLINAVEADTIALLAQANSASSNAITQAAVATAAASAAGTSASTATTKASEAAGSASSAAGYLSTIAGYFTNLASSAGAAMVGWIQSGTGAVLRLVQDKLRESLSVKDFGAVGDGVTNDLPAFQKAYAAAANLGKTLRIPAGRYLAGGIVFDKSINVFAEEDVWILASANTQDIVKIVGYDRYAGKVTRYKISGFVVDANGFTGCSGMRLADAAIFSAGFENIAVNGCAIGWYNTGNQFCVFDKCSARNCTIGFRQLDQVGSTNGGGNNNVFIGPSANICQVAYMFGRTGAPYPLHSIEAIGAIAIGSSFCNLYVKGYQALKFNGLSPESTLPAQTSAVYDGETVYSGLADFDGAYVSISDWLIASNGGASLNARNSSYIDLQNVDGAVIDIACDSSSIVTSNGRLGTSNGTKVSNASLQSMLLATNQIKAGAVMPSVYSSPVYKNLIDKPNLIGGTVFVSPSITYGSDWCEPFGYCASIKINDATSNKGITIDVNYKPNALLYAGILLMADKDCSVKVDVQAATNGVFNLKAFTPRRVFATGNATNGVVNGFGVLIMDTSGAKIYMSKAMFTTIDFLSLADLSEVAANGAFNPNDPLGDVVRFPAAPGFNAATSVGAWSVGHVVYLISPAAAGVLGYVCTTAGTYGALAGVTATGALNDKKITVSATLGLQVGYWINIAGVTGQKRIVQIDGTTVYLDSGINAAVTGAAVTFTAPVFKSFGAIAA